jgi:hypothetical protein
MGPGHNEHNIFLLHLRAGTVTPPTRAHGCREGGSPIQAWQQEGSLPFRQPSKFQPTSILRLRRGKCQKQDGDTGDLERSRIFLNRLEEGNEFANEVATGFERHPRAFCNAVM